jgi:hypothetical protein
LSVALERGAFYNGTRTSLSTSRGRVQITPQIIVEPGLTIDWVELPVGHFVNKLVTARTSYALTPRMSASALVQYNSVSGVSRQTSGFGGNISQAASCSP